MSFFFVFRVLDQLLIDIPKSHIFT